MSLKARGKLLEFVYNQPDEIDVSEDTTVHLFLISPSGTYLSPYGTPES